MKSCPESALGLAENDIEQPMLLFQNRHKELQRIFNIMGLGDLPKDINEVVNLTQPWTMGDHSRPGYEYEDFTVSQKNDLRSIFVDLEMVKERVLGGQSVDDLLFCAAIFAGALRRSELLTRMVQVEALRPNRILILSGERRPFKEVEAEDFRRTIQEIKQNQLEDPWLDELIGANAPMDRLWETDMMRVAAMRHMGKISLKNTVLRDDTDEHGIPKLKYHEFEWQGIPVILNHSLAVPRPMGEPRATTEQSMKDYVLDHKPVINSKAVLLSAQPHMHRMALSTARTLRAAGRGDINIMPAASRVGNIKESFYLGEIARMLWEEREWQKNQPRLL